VAWIASCICWPQVPVVEDEADSAKKPEKMAIGGEGGFQVDKPKFSIDKEFALIIMPDRAAIPLPCAELPELVLDVITAIQVRGLAASPAGLLRPWPDPLRPLPSATHAPCPLDPGARQRRQGRRRGGVGGGAPREQVRRRPGAAGHRAQDQPRPLHLEV
jgi:hypothetical protein